MPQGGSCLGDGLLRVMAQLARGVHHLAPPGQVVRSGQEVGGRPHGKAHPSSWDRVDI